MGVVVISVVFLLTVALGAAVAKGVLTLVVRFLIDRQIPAVSVLRTAAAGLVALVR